MSQPPPDPQALLGAVRDFVDGDAPFGRWEGGGLRDGVITAAWVALSPEASGFVESAYAGHWIRPDIRWSEWIGSAAGQRLWKDPAALAEADAAEIAHLLTALVRGDRFNEGLLNATHADGTLRRILARVAELAAR